MSFALLLAASFLARRLGLELRDLPGAIGRDARRELPVGPGEGIGPCSVLYVIDGDTLDVDCGSGRERVRLLRIDTPEREEPGYAEARAALERLVAGHDVDLVFEEPGRPARGDHGRLLAYVFAGDTNLNVELVRLGWSEFWTRYGEGRFAGSFESAEAEARAAGRGLWGKRFTGR